MKSLYIASSHSFKEQPQLEQPIAKDSDLHAFRIDDFIHRVGEYEMHLQQLRLIPCRPTDKWEEGVLYEEGKDYVVDWWEEVVKDGIGRGSNPYVIVSLTFSNWHKETPPTTEEAELWKEVAADISGATSYITIEVAKGEWKTAQDIVNKLYASLQQKYSLSPRSEQNSEAIEFGDFLKSYASIEHAGKILWWDKIQGSSRFYSTEQLFQLFKQKQ